MPEIPNLGMCHQLLSRKAVVDCPLQYFEHTFGMAKNKSTSPCICPWLAKKPPHEALFWLTLPHAFRHVGMVFLVPGVVAQPLPESFANPAAYGDLLTGVLALVALMALRTSWGGAVVLVWLFRECVLSANLDSRSL